jgi:hypothetical protein
MFSKRLGEKVGELRCSGGYSCPQILEMSSGDYAAAGEDITSEAVGFLPPGPGVGPKERIVRIPRHVMVAARAEIPATL